MKKISFIIFALFISGLAAQAQVVQQYANLPFDNNIAQDFQFAEHTNQEMAMTSYDKDPLAHALVLKEFGRAAISSNGNTTPLTFDYHIKIKLFDKQALDRGSIELPVYIQDNGSYEEIRLTSVEAITMYTDDKGVFKEININPDSIRIVKKNQHLNVVKFNMPGMRPGCIIEYRYSLESPYLDKFRTWEFQSDIPKLSSEYEVHIPKVFGYNISLRGTLKLTKDTAVVEKNCFESTDIRSDCAVEDYMIKDIPAYKPEPFASSPKNYMSALYFQLTNSTELNNYATLNQSFQKDEAVDWSHADNTLRYHDNFGDQLNKKSFFKDKLNPVLAGATDSLDKAKAIYYFIKNSIKNNNLNSIYADEGVKKAFENHTGNVADINLALTDALKMAELNAEPVLISTRDNGMVNDLYPAITEFNYVIVMLNVKGATYLLDAADPLLPFGMLNYQDLNGRGRVIPIVRPSYWVDINTGQKKANTYTIDLTLDENGEISGTANHYAVSYAAYEKRQQIKNYASTDDYVKNIASGLPGVTLAKTAIGGVDSIEMPVSEVFNIAVASAGNSVSVDPFMFNTIGTNPFQSNTRSTPVDFGMPSVMRLSLTIHLPANYTIDNAPQNLTMNLPNNGGGYATTFESDNNTITYSQILRLNKPVYSVEEYSFLKPFFDQVVDSEKVKFTFKKK